MRRWQQGFTLMETLIALVLTSLLLLALFGSFRAGIASWQAVDRQVEQSEPQQRLDRLLYRHLSQLQGIETSRGFLMGSRDEQMFFEARSDRIRYAAALALSVDNRVYAIELASAPGGRSGLWMRFVPYAQKDVGQALDAAEFVQVSDSLTARFSYFVEDEWFDELEEDTLPLLISVHWRSPERVWSATTYAVSRGQ